MPMNRRAIVILCEVVMYSYAYIASKRTDVQGLHEARAWMDLRRVSPQSASMAGPGYCPEHHDQHDEHNDMHWLYPTIDHHP